MATYDHVAFLEAASDPTTADLLDTIGTQTRAAAARLVSQVAATEIAQASPEIAQAAADLIATAAGIILAQSSPLVDDAVVGLTDEDGARLPGAQWDQYGRPSNLMMQTLASRGMLRVAEGTSGGLQMTDMYGALTWFSVGPDGGFNHTTFTYIVNRLGWAVSAEKPYVYPGNTVLWLNSTDLTLHRLENR